jgi:hypothetical protein
MEPRRWDPLNPKRAPALRTPDAPVQPPQGDKDDLRTAIAREKSTATKKLTKAQLRSRKLTQQALARFTEGFSIHAIAEDMGVAPSTVTGWLTRHRRDVAEGSIDEQLDQIAVPLAVENLTHGLLAGDKDYTLKTLEGRGVFKRHSDKGDLPPDLELPALIIRIEGATPSHVSLAAEPGAALVPGGHIVGTPALKQIEGKVVARDAPESDEDGPSD